MEIQLCESCRNQIKKRIEFLIKQEQIDEVSRLSALNELYLLTGEWNYFYNDIIKRRHYEYNLNQKDTMIKHSAKGEK